MRYNFAIKFLVTCSVCQAIGAVLFVKTNAVNSPSGFFAGVRQFMGRSLGFIVDAGQRRDEIDDPLANFWIMDPGEGQVQMETLGCRQKIGDIARV